MKYFLIIRVWSEASCFRECSLMQPNPNAVPLHSYSCVRPPALCWPWVCANGSFSSVGHRRCAELPPSSRLSQFLRSTPNLWVLPRPASRIHLMQRHTMDRHTAFKASVSIQDKFWCKTLLFPSTFLIAYLVWLYKEFQHQTEEQQPLCLCRSLRSSLHRWHLDETERFKIFAYVQNVSRTFWSFRHNRLYGTLSISCVRSPLNTLTSPSVCPTSVSNSFTFALQFPTRACETFKNLSTWSHFLLSNINWDSPEHQRSLPPGVSALK